MRVVLRRAAKLDLAQACRWYDERESSLGDSLRAEVDSTIETIREHPKLYAPVDHRVRRAALDRFPFGIFYTHGNDTIRIFAILHHARNPKQWKSRSP